MIRIEERQGAEASREDMAGSRGGGSREDRAGNAVRGQGRGDGSGSNGGSGDGGGDQTGNGEQTRRRPPPTVAGPSSWDIMPELDRLILFRSGDVRHQVLPPVGRDRYALTIWFTRRALDPFYYRGGHRRQRGGGRSRVAAAAVGGSPQSRGSEVWKGQAGYCTACYDLPQQLQR